MGKKQKSVHLWPIKNVLKTEMLVATNILNFNICTCQ